MYKLIYSKGLSLTFTCSHKIHLFIKNFTALEWFQHKESREYFYAMTEMESIPKQCFRNEEGGQPPGN